MTRDGISEGTTSTCGYLRLQPAASQIAASSTWSPEVTKRNAQARYHQTQPEVEEISTLSTQSSNIKQPWDLR
jgi:hypothetical protein